MIKYYRVDRDIKHRSLQESIRSEDCVLKSRRGHHFYIVRLTKSNTIHNLNDRTYATCIPIHMYIKSLIVCIILLNIKLGRAKNIARYHYTKCI